MTTPIESIQFNFPIQNLPHNSETFYNSKEFAQNELKFLGVAIKMMEEAFERGQKYLQDAINGLS